MDIVDESKIIQAEIQAGLRKAPKRVQDDTDTQSGIRCASGKPKQRKLRPGTARIQMPMVQDMMTPMVGDSHLPQQRYTEYRACLKNAMFTGVSQAMGSNSETLMQNLTNSRDLHNLSEELLVPDVENPWLIMGLTLAGIVFETAVQTRGGHT